MADEMEQAEASTTRRVVGGVVGAIMGGAIGFGLGLMPVFVFRPSELELLVVYTVPIGLVIGIGTGYLLGEWLARHGY